MLEELLANTTFMPVLIAVCVAIAIVCFSCGWIGNGIGAKRRAKAFNRQIFEAKAAVPQLETVTRSQEVKIVRLEEETKGLTNNSIELAHDLDNKEKELRSSERKVRNLTSELAALKGIRDGDNMIMDGFEDEGLSADTSTEASSPVVAKLKKTEALYEKLKNALIQRDDQILALEAQLEVSQTKKSGEPANTEQSQSDNSQALQEQIRTQESKINALKIQLEEVNQEKAMLADMAKSRSQNNKSLKEASVLAEGQIPKLKEDIEARDKTITDREGSISRYLRELKELKVERAERKAEVVKLSKQVRDHSQELTSRDDRITSLGEDIQERENRVAALVVEINGLKTTIENTQTVLQEREETITQQQSSLAGSSAQLEKQLQTTNTMQGVIKDRDFKIETLTNDIAEMKANLDKAEQQASDAFDMFEKRKKSLAMENTTSRESNDVMNRKVDDLGAQLAQGERWMARTKQTLHDREKKLQELENIVADIQSQNEKLTSELHEESQARRSAETDARATGRQFATQETEAQHTISQLKEQDQTIAVFKSTVTELEIKVSSFSTEIASLTKQLENGESEHHAATKAK